LFSSASALLADKCLADIDCIISDVSMPQIDGFSLQVRVSAIRPNLPVILISGRIAKPELGYTSGTTSRTVLEKLFDGKNLLAAVSTALNTARARDGRIAPNQYPTNTNT